eukprot:gene8666-17882_t
MNFARRGSFLNRKIKYGLNFTVQLRPRLRAVDMNEPHLWYPLSRMMKSRQIICHVGPTNSGKTHHALQALEKSRSGLYCGPLRLLAWEICEKLIFAGVPCNLLTGQENEIIENATHTSCTIEMADLKEEYDCAVLDEAQLLGDRSRGWAWTQALLGLRAKEIHLCGSPSFLNIVKNICAKTGDTLEIRTYDRLSPLYVHKKALSSYTKVQPGDCVIGFTSSSSSANLRGSARKTTGTVSVSVPASVPAMSASSESLGPTILGSHLNNVQAMQAYLRGYMPLGKRNNSNVATATTTTSSSQRSLSEKTSSSSSYDGNILLSARTGGLAQLSFNAGTSMLYSMVQKKQ